MFSRVGKTDLRKNREHGVVDGADIGLAQRPVLAAIEARVYRFQFLRQVRFTRGNPGRARITSGGSNTRPVPVSANFRAQS